eukprot:CAMPEP_0194764636 /NCGR_PEP_ID=MMETSP0323_2-20130528/23559_1 /TAXON_ID=2866 ORGANISM="Crypthecodinium cohnii, Strain Seligo" /NCGR_SAMPLE_ID=MMETSP0323_2 /ASSEMBLY_ACC=CAM_ASM_000346 /LENGTH=222 /DNA_ID=CAMNT_0039692325 /DNA_START=87 /DNA_END=752 /DNA_ORIENTATION=+
MSDEVVYLPDDEDSMPAEDLSAVLAEGTQASVQELCSSAPSAILVLGCLLLVIALLIISIRIAWAIYAADIADFYRDVSAAEAEAASTESTVASRGQGHTSPVVSSAAQPAAAAAAAAATAPGAQPLQGPVPVAGGSTVAASAVPTLVAASMLATAMGGMSATTPSAASMAGTAAPGVMGNPPTTIMPNIVQGQGQSGPGLNSSDGSDLHVRHRSSTGDASV